MLDPNGVNISWCIPPEDNAPLYDGWHRTLLTPQERERCDRFVRTGDRHNFLAARWLVRTALSRLIPTPLESWVFEPGPNGKPFVVAPEAGRVMEFSVAHTEGLVVCAITRGRRIGIDAEGIRESPENMEIARRRFCPSEVQLLEARSGQERAEAFASLWTLKEAFSKAIGQGLRIRLDALGFRLGDQGPPVAESLEHPGEDAARWEFFFVADPGPGWKVAVAVHDPPASLTRSITRLDPPAEPA